MSIDVRRLARIGQANIDTAIATLLVAVAHLDPSLVSTRELLESVSELNRVRSGLDRFAGICASADKEEAKP